MSKEPVKPHLVSAYNHRSIGTEEKPLISNKDFSFLHQQVKDGNHKAYRDADEKYSFDTRQCKMLLDIIENRIV